LAGGRADVHARCAPEIVWAMRRRTLLPFGRLPAIVMVEKTLAAGDFCRADLVVYLNIISRPRHLGA